MRTFSPLGWIAYTLVHRSTATHLAIAVILAIWLAPASAQSYSSTVFNGAIYNGVAQKFYSYEAAANSWGAQQCPILQCGGNPPYTTCMTTSQIFEGIAQWSTICANCDSGTCLSGGGVSGGSASGCAAGTFDSGVGACGVAATDENPAKRARTPDCAGGSSIEGNSTVGNPCNPASGIKVQVETDYVGSGPFPLRIQRTYESSSVSGLGRSLGPQWGHNYEGHILHDQSSRPNLAVVIQADGRTLVFQLINSVWTGDADLRISLTKSGSIWQLKDEGNFTYQFEQQPSRRMARLISITDRSGLAHTLQYYPSNAGYRAGLLQSVADAMGRQLLFDYDTMGQRLSKVTDPDSKDILYTYNPDAMLATVQYQDNKTRQYVYNEPTHTSNVSGQWLLTGIIDENGDRFATYEYHPDSERRSKATWHGDNDAQKYELSYGSSSTDVTMHVTSGITATRTYNFATTLSVKRLTSITGPEPCPECGPAALSYTNGFLSSATNWNGHTTTYLRQDATRPDLETSRTEASSTPVARTIATTWHSTFRIPAEIAEPGRTTSFTHDGNGNVLTKTVTSGGQSRTWTYTYNSNGSVLTINGPRTDVADITTITYYANDDPVLGKRGNVATITNPVGHVTTITNYNVHGQPLTIVDPNGLTTNLTYDFRQRLLSRDVGGELTSYEYDNAGQLTRVIFPDGSFLSYTYDKAHRLTRIEDNLNNRIVYTLDGMGNRTLEQISDPVNVVQSRSRLYSNRNRLSHEIGALGQTTAYLYDLQGNLTSVDGPLTGAADTTTHAYDALNRLFRTTDPAGQVTYGLNALDQVTSVTDQRNLVTQYSINGLGNLDQQISPDTGTTGNSFDAAGNVLSQTDAKGQSTSYTYDALNRVTSITYQGGVTHTFSYDQGVNGTGRLTGIAEPNSTTQYVYNQKGRLTSETRTINGTPYVISYNYDLFGRMIGLTYPSGRQVTYGFDGLGRVQQIDTHMDGSSQMVVGSVAYHPFGHAKGFMFGNAQTYARTIDMDGRIASYTLASQAFGVGYDAASRVSTIFENGNPTNFIEYKYDDIVDRLTRAILPATTHVYSYDAVGNRLTRGVGGSSDTYVYSGSSNRLSSITPTSGPVRNYSHDLNGSVTGDGTNIYTYDTRGRLTQATSSLGATNYQINALGQRIRKTNVQGDTVYHYDKDGRLIAESGTAGTVQKEYIYLGDIPVAVVQ